MSSEEKGIGYLETSEEEKKRLALSSHRYSCEICGFKADMFIEGLKNDQNLVEAAAINE